MPDIKVIIPAFNEEHGIGEVLEELKKTLQGLESACEIIVVDDGSVDKTETVLTNLSKELSFLNKK